MPSLIVRVVTAPVMVPLLWIFASLSPNPDPEPHPLTFWQFAKDYVTGESSDD